MLWPGFQGNPSATIPIPSLVFLMKAMSTGSASRSRPANARTSSIRRTQRCSITSPLSAMSAAHSWMALWARAVMGATAA